MEMRKDHEPFVGSEEVKKSQPRKKSDPSCDSANFHGEGAMFVGRAVDAGLVDEPLGPPDTDVLFPFPTFPTFPPLSPVLPVPLEVGPWLNPELLGPAMQ